MQLSILSETLGITSLYRPQCCTSQQHFHSILSFHPFIPSSRVYSSRLGVQGSELRSLILNFISWDFPGGPVVKILPSNAGDMDLISGHGIKIPHAEE